MHEELYRPGGRVRTYHVDDYLLSRKLALPPYCGARRPKLPGWTKAVEHWTHNLVLYEWGAVAGRLLTQGLTSHRISMMYIEFSNVLDVDTSVPVPDFDRTNGNDYYNGLSGGDTDYLRVPLTAATLLSSDEDVYPNGNLMTFFAMTQGVTGVHGTAFSAGSISRVFGGALVAAVDESDATQDLIFSRFYMDEADQPFKQESGQVGLEWEIALK